MKDDKPYISDLIQEVKPYLRKSNFEMVQEFQKTFSPRPDPEVPTIPDELTVILRSRLIFEESKETFDEINVMFVDQAGQDNVDLSFQPYQPVDLHKYAKELADLLYVVYGAAAEAGIPIDSVFDEVHRSNMSKLGQDGKPIYREDGKVMKGPNYSVANIKKVF